MRMDQAASCLKRTIICDEKVKGGSSRLTQACASSSHPCLPIHRQTITPTQRRTTQRRTTQRRTTQGKEVAGNSMHGIMDDEDDFDMVQRKWILQKMDQWMEQQQEKVFVLVGKLGVGKTVILDQVRSRAHAVAATFAFGNGTLTHYEALQSIGAQLGVPNLLDPSLSQQENSEMKLVLVDNVHRCEPFIAFLFQHLARLPQSIKWIVSTRPRDSIKPSPGVTVFHVSEDDKRNVADVQKYLETKLREARVVEGEYIQVGAKILLERCHGNFFFARFLSNMVFESSLNPQDTQSHLLCSVQELATLKSFPNSMVNVYREKFSELIEAFGAQFGSEKRGKKVLREAVSPLLAARKPLPMEGCWGEMAGEAAEMLKDWLTLTFTNDGKVSQVGLCHWSVAEFLSKKKLSGRKCYIGEREGHDILASWCLENPMESHYSLTNLLYHIIKARRVPDLDLLLSHNYPWLRVYVANNTDWKCLAGYTKDEFAKETARALCLSSAALENDPRELCGQLHCRLSDDHPMRKKMHAGIDLPGIQPLWKNILAKCTSPLRVILDSFERGVHHVMFSQGGDYLIASTLNGSVNVWYMQSLKLVHHVQRTHSRARVLKIALVNSDKLLASFMDNGEILFWDFRNNLYKHNLKLPSPKCKVYFPHRGKSFAVNHFAVALEDGSVQIWDTTVEVESFTTITAGPRLVHEFRGYGGGVNQVEFCPSGELVAAAMRDKTARIWNVRNGQPIHVMNDFSDQLCDIKFSCDGSMLGTSDVDNSLKIWDVRSGKLIKSWVPYKVCHAQSLEFSPNDDFVLTVATIEKPKLWRVPTGELLFTLKTDAWVNDARFSPCGAYIASYCDSRAIQIWSCASGNLLHNLCGHSSLVEGIAFPPQQENTLVSCSRDKSVRIWDLQAIPKDSKHENTSERIAKSRLKEKERGNGESICHFAISARGDRIATFSSDSMLRIHDTETGNIIQQVLESEFRFLDGLTFGPTGKRIALYADQESLKLFACENLKQSFVLMKRARLLHVAFSMDGSLLLVPSDSGFNVAIWDTNSGRRTHEMPGHSDDITCIVASQCGMMYATCSKDSTVCVHTGPYATTPRVLRGHGDPVCFAEFSPTSATLASYSEDQVLIVWDPTSGSQVQRLKMAQPCTKLCYSDDGNRLGISTANMRGVALKVIHVLTGEVLFKTDGYFPIRDIDPEYFAWQRDRALYYDSIPRTEGRRVHSCHPNGVGFTLDEPVQHAIVKRSPQGNQTVILGVSGSGQLFVLSDNE